MADNCPYVGPTSFGEKERRRFYGRDDEARELSYLLVAKRAVLLYAQSGAGKTSLLRAKVIPELVESGDMHVLPITRVSGPAEGDNVYVANTLAGLGMEGTSLTEAVAQLFDEPEEMEDPVPHLLIFDQFEEVFTFHPEQVCERREFFIQLRECLATYSKLGVLFCMREDYLADMEAFAGYLPDRLRTRMRMERLSDKQAEDAIALPAKEAGRPFAPGVARKLTDDLRRIQKARGMAELLGKYVEPVQLQIVCRQMWLRLPDAVGPITEAQTKEFARVDDALTGFYRDSLKAVRDQYPLLRERTLRDWFGKCLITTAKTRGLVYQGDAETEGLPNGAVEVLAGKYIVRPDNRPSGVWYELAHDRLVDPIIDDNAEWNAGYSPVARGYERWVAAGSNTDKLLKGNLLAEAVEFAKKEPQKLSSEEQAFLNASTEADRKERRRKRVAALTATAVVSVIVTLAGVAAWQGWQAQRRLAQVQKFVAHSMVARAFINSLEKPDQSLAYLEDALLRDPDSLEARRWIASILLDHPRTLPLKVKDKSGVERQLTTWDPAKESTVIRPAAGSGSRRVIFAAGGKQLITWIPGTRVKVQVWDAVTGKAQEPLKMPIGREVYDLSADGKRAVINDDAGFVRIIDTATGTEGARIPAEAPENLYWRAVLSPNGEYAATYGKHGLVRFWQASTGKKLSEIQVEAESSDTGKYPLTAFGTGGESRLVAVGGWHSAQVYDVETGAARSKPITLRNDLMGLAMGPGSDKVTEIATVTRPGFLTLWNPGGKRVSGLMGDGSFLTDVRYSADGAFLLTRAFSVARFWDRKAEQPVSLIIGDADSDDARDLTDVVPSPDGKFVALSDTKLVRVLRTAIDIGEDLEGETRLLANLAGAVGGYRLSTAKEPEQIPAIERISRLGDLLAMAEKAPSGRPTVSSFLRRYFGLDAR